MRKNGKYKKHKKMKLTKNPWLFLNKGVLIEYVENVLYKFIESVEIQIT